MTILFERHVFSRLTDHRYDATHPTLSNPLPGGYGNLGAAQYDRLIAATALDANAALESCSWGIGQVMGFQASALGYDNVQDMIGQMRDSEGSQLDAMARFIKTNSLDGALRVHDWARFARGYNGPNYRINNYDTRLAATYEHMARGALPDLTVRAAQTYLTFLGFDPHGIDGIMGRLTRAAMNDYQTRKGIPLTDFVDDVTVSALTNDCAS